MIQLRHILHPVRSGKSLCRRAHAFTSKCVYGWLTEREYRKIARGRRDQCWCGGGLRPFKWHFGYAVCADCGCYVNRYPPLPEALKEVYSLDRYWHLRQKMRGYPPIEARGEQYLAEGRVDYWLTLVDRYGPSRGRAIEIGCAPGVLLVAMQRRGYECIGVEPDEQTAEWIRHNLGVEVRKGMFPGVELPPCDLFMAFDVAEHSPDPAAFWTEIRRALQPGGVAILQTPIERYDYEHPFKKTPDWFDDVEHLFLFTDRAVERLTDLARLELIALEDANLGLGQICVLRRTP